MKTNLIILALFVALMLSCKKEQTEPIPVKQFLTVDIKGNGYLKDFTVNGSTVSSPATVYSGDKVYIRIVTLYTSATVNYKVSLDGKILYEAINSSGGLTTNLQIK